MRIGGNGHIDRQAVAADHHTGRVQQVDVTNRSFWIERTLDPQGTAALPLRKDRTSASHAKPKPEAGLPSFVMLFTLGNGHESVRSTRCWKPCEKPQRKQREYPCHAADSMLQGRQLTGGMFLDVGGGQGHKQHA